MTDEDIAGASSRRTFIKRAGIGTAAVWAAPSVLSLAAAHAQGSAACGPYECSEEGACPDGTPNCLCAPHNQGGEHICWFGGACSGTPENICETDADCAALFGAGSKCAQVGPSCGQCAGATTFCVTNYCGNGAGAAGAGGLVALA